jgi:hypothetical protein
MGEPPRTAHGGAAWTTREGATEGRRGGHDRGAARAQSREGAGGAAGDGAWALRAPRGG